KAAGHDRLRGDPGIFILLGEGVADATNDAPSHAPIGPRQHRLEQHLAAGLRLARLDALGLVVREAVLARGEDHRGGDAAGDVDGVMAGAGDDFSRLVAKAFGGLFDQGDAFGVEGLRRVLEDALDFELYPAVAGDEAGFAGELRVEAVDLGVGGVAELHGKAHLAGDHVAAVGRDQKLTHGAAAVLAAGAHHAVDEVDHPGGADQGVAAGGGRRGAGVGILAGGDGVVPHHRLRAGDDADLLGVALQDRTLLDVQLEIG